MSHAPEHYIAGLDVGSSTIALLLAERDEEGGGLRYVAGARVASVGVQNGVIVNVGEATAAIERAASEVEDRIGGHLPPACVGVGGRHLGGQNLRGHLEITPLGREIVPDDVARAIVAAREGLHVGENREVLHEIPRAYMVDGQAGVHDPHGLAGYALDVEVHYATAAATALHNLLKCVRQAGIDPDLAVAAPLAIGEAVHAGQRAARNLAVVDIGADTANLAIYVNGTVWMTDVLLTAGAAITHAISAQLKIPTAVAEELKLRHGQCYPRAVGEFDLVEMPESAGVEAVIPHAELVRIIQERAYGLADELAERLEDARHAGVEPEELLLTGGGAALPGLEELLRTALELPVYHAATAGIADLPDAPGERDGSGWGWATAAGLAIWYARYAGPGRRAGGRKRQRALAGSWKRLLGVVMP